MIIHRKTDVQCLPTCWVIIFCWLSLVAESHADDSTNKADWGADLNHLFDLRAMFRSPLCNYYFITDRSTQRSRWFTTKKSIQGIEPLHYIPGDQILLIKHYGKMGYLAWSKAHISDKVSSGVLKSNTSSHPNRIQSKPAILPSTSTANSSNVSRSHASHTTTKNLSDSSLPVSDEAGFSRNRISRSNGSTAIIDTAARQKTPRGEANLDQSHESETLSAQRRRGPVIVKQPRPLNYVVIELPEESVK